MWRRRGDGGPGRAGEVLPVPRLGTQEGERQRVSGSESETVGSEPETMAGAVGARGKIGGSSLCRI